LGPRAHRPVALTSCASLVLCGVALCGVEGDAWAIDVDDVGGETLTIDINNTSEIAYHFDNRNDTDVAGTLTPAQHVDDNYGEWYNRLYIRANYWKFSLGVRVDSAVYFNTFDRDDARELILDELGPPGDLDLENRFARELHSRYTSLIYPTKLWLGFKHKELEVTLGDYYLNLGRGLVFNVRKIDEVGVDTTVRGGKLKGSTEIDDFQIEGTLFGGQLNPIRIDFATGRILHGDSPLFFGFPEAGDFEFFNSTSPDSFVRQTELAKPSYLEDSVVGGNLTLGPKQVQFGGNVAALFRQSNSEDKARCLELGARTADQCATDFPSFNTPEASRAHDQVINFSGTVRVPPIDETVDIYVEVAGQNQRQGRVTAINPDSTTKQEDDLWGYAVYANVNVTIDPIALTLEGKHYRSFFPLGANIDTITPGFSAGEYNIVTYSRPPTAESIYVEPIGAPDVCVTGGRARADLTLAPGKRVYAWLGHYTSFTEINASNNTCETDDSLRTETWDTAAGGEIDLEEGKTHYWGWIGARLTDAGAPIDTLAGRSDVFYREGYVRYDFNQHLAGDFSLSAVGYHRRQYEPLTISQSWHEGENLLALNWSPHWSFIFGYEYQTRPGLPTHYFNGAIQFRSKSHEHWYEQLTDLVRLYIGQRRAALRCVGGVCRVFPAFEGAKLELVSTF
jgi:hypothetical protein